ncbi:MAG TPA: DedA family protein, partial [Limnochordia bacterium]
LSLAGVTAAGVAGFAAGSLVPYYLARRHGRALLNGRRRWFVVRSEDLARVERWFERYGPRAVLIGRLIPIVRDFISIPAGLAAMPLLRFIAYTMVGSLPWIFLVALAGQFLEAHWQRLLEWVEVGNQAVLIVLALLVIALGVWLWLRRRSESPSP